MVRAGVDGWANRAGTNKRLWGSCCAAFWRSIWLRAVRRRWRRLGCRSHARRGSRVSICRQRIAIKPKRWQSLLAVAIVRAQERQQIAELFVVELREARHRRYLVRAKAGRRLGLRAILEGNAALLDPLNPVGSRDILGIWQLEQLA